MQREYIITAVGTGVGLVVGALAGYRYAEMKLEEKYNKIASEEIAEARAHYATVNKDAYESPMDMAKDVIPPETLEALVQYNGRSLEEEVVVEERSATVINIFNNSGDERFLDPEQRDPEKPYIITEKEYLEGEPDFEQQSLTYYAADDVLADDRDQIVPDHSLVGDDNLVRFGLGSNDKNMLYIRNEKDELDFEIAKHEGSYAKEVHGWEVGDDG